MVVCSCLFVTSPIDWLEQVTIQNPSLHISCKFRASFKGVTEREEVAVTVIIAWDISGKSTSSPVPAGLETVGT